MAIDIKRPLRKLLPCLLDARPANLNEADTVQRIIRVFEDVLGYDLLSDVSREAQVKNKYVDIAIKVDGVVRLLIEAKSAGTVLRERHIEQAQSYASRHNLQWVLLTNGIDWRLFHLTFEEGIEYQEAFAVDLSATDRLDDAFAKLGLLHKQAIRRGELEQFWRTTHALGPASIARGLFHEDALNVIRRLIRKHEGMLIDTEDLARSIHEMLTTGAREQIGPLRIVRKRKVARRAAAGAVEGSEAGPGTDAAEPGDEDGSTPAPESDSDPVGDVPATSDA